MAMGILAISMNSVAIWILLSEKKMQSMFLHILAFSFVCDNGYILAEIIATLYHEFGVVELMWTLPYFAYPFKEIFYAANILTTIALSYERYSLLFDQTGYRAKMEVAEFRYHRLKKYVVAITLFSVLINIPSFCTYSISKVNTDDGNNLEWKRLKTPLRKDQTYILLDKAVKWSIILVVAFALLIFLNRKVYKHVKGKMKYIRKSNENSTISDKQLEMSTDRCLKCSARLNFIKKLRKQEKFTLALFAVVSGFLFCNIWYLIEVILKAIDSGIVYNCLRMYDTLSRFMRTFNACTNVLLYCCVDRTFNRYLKRYLCRVVYLLSCTLINLQSSSSSYGENSHVISEPPSKPAPSLMYRSTTATSRVTSMKRVLATNPSP